MNISPQERKALQARYSAPKGKILKWAIWQCGKIVKEENTAGLAQSYIDKNQLKNAFKKPVYEPTRQS